MRPSKLQSLSAIGRGVGYSLLYHTGAIARARERNRSHARILLYHSVAPEKSPFTQGLGVTVTPETFAKQIDYLQRHYRVVSLAQLESMLVDGTLHDRVAVITFDDGFGDNFRYAYPILRERGLSATIFLVADAMQTGSVLWMHRLAYFVNMCDPNEVLRIAEEDLDQKFLGPAPAVALRRLREKLTSGVGRAARERFLGRISDELDARPESALQSDGLYLTKNQLQEMRGNNIDFGSHGATHTAFAVMSENEQEKELRSAWQIVAPLVQDRPPPFAYPFGERRHYSHVTERLALKVGHRSLLATGGGWVRATTGLTQLNRVKVEEESVSAFAARIEGVYLRSGLKGIGGSPRSS